MSGLEALDFLKSNQVSVVLAEEGLDDRPGHEVLAWLQREQPHSGRMLLVDSAEYPTAVSLLKEGIVHRLLRKPLDEVEWRETVEDLLREQLNPAVERDDYDLEFAHEAQTATRQADSYKEELARSGHFLALRDVILEKIPDTLLAVDEQLIVRYLNRPTPGVSGRPRRYVDRPLREVPFGVLLNVDQLEEAILKMFKTQQSVVFPEAELHGENSPVQRWSVNLEPLVDRHGLSLALIRFHEITAERLLWDSYVQADKMAGVGALAGGVAHEFNNLIGGIHGFAQLAQMSGKQEDNQKLIEAATQASKRARKIADSLLRMALQSETRMEVVEIGNLVDQVVTLVERSFRKYNITIDQAIEELFSVRSNNHGLQQVLLHFLMSARAGLEKGGVIRIRAGRAVDGRFWLGVEDHGPAVPDEALRHAFRPDEALLEPAVRDTSRTRGLGLAVCQAVMSRLGGEVVLENREGGGCLITLFLPADVVVS